MKKFSSLSFLLLFAFSSYSQKLIDLGENNPTLKGPSRIRKALPSGDQLYIGGNINFVNNERTPPIVRLNADGSTDETFQFEGGYSIEFENEFTGPALTHNGALYVHGLDGVMRINADGSIDESFGFSASAFVNSMITYRDSILVLSSASTLNLYAEDGNFRTIENDLSEQYLILALHKLSDNKILVVVQDKVTAVFKCFQYLDDLVNDANFTPFTINQPSNQKHLELLSDGKIFIAGSNLTVNETTGNGIYTIDETGAIDLSSPHNADLSFIDVFDTGIQNAIPLSDGKIMVIGRVDDNDFNKLAVARLLSSGARDDSFITRSYETSDSQSDAPKLIQNSDNSIFLIHSQFNYDNEASGGINRIDTDGNDTGSHNVSVNGISSFRQMIAYDTERFLITGTFTEPLNSNIPFLTGFSFDSEADFSWLNNIDISNEDIIGAIKVASNGDVLVGAYDRDSNEVLRVLKPDGSIVDFGTNGPTAFFVESPIYNIHETLDSFYLTGIFTYQTNSQLKSSILKLDKDYNIIQDYASDAEVALGDRVTFSHLTKDEGLIIQKVNVNNSTNSIVKLLPDGTKDDSFNEIVLSGNVGFDVSNTFVVNDSLLLHYETNFNDSQVVQTYDFDGTLVDDNFITFNNDGNIRGIQQLSDTTLLVSGSFSSINGINKNGIAIISYDGAVYDDLDLDITGSIDVVKIYNDTLFILGPGVIEGQIGGGFYALPFLPNSLEIESVSVTEAGTIELLWKEDLTIRTIEVFRTDPENNEVLLASLEKGTVSFVDETAEVNSLYEYKIVSKNTIGENLASTSFEIVKPDSPTGLTVSFTDGDNLLSWTDASSNETGFEIYRSIGENEFVLHEEVGIDVSTYTDDGIEIDNDFSYFVVASSSNFQSDPSNTVEISVFRPAAPINPSFELTSDEGVVSVTLNWENSDSDTEDFIVLESLNNVDFEPLDTVNVSVTTFSKVIPIDALYYYQVLSKNEVGNSDPSLTVEVDAFRPGAPTNLSSEFDDDSQTINLTWTASDEKATSFFIFESLDNVDFSPIDTVDALTFSRTVETIDVFYYYYVVAGNIAGNSAPSTALEVSTTVLGLELNYEHSIYPNPTTGNFQILLNERSIDQIVISDLNGKIQRRISAKNKAEFKIEDLSSGVYIANFLSKGEIVESQKVVVKIE